MLLLCCLPSLQAQAQVTSACMPFGFGTLAGRSPVTSFAAEGIVSTRKLLYQRAWTPPLSRYDCITDPDAKLSLTPELSGTNFVFARKSFFMLRNGVKVVLESDDDKSALGISESLFTIAYSTTITCNNGNPLAVEDVPIGYIVKGINAPMGCAGDFVVTYDISVWQAATSVFPSQFKSFTLGGVGFAQRHQMQYGNGVNAYSRGGSLNNSPSFVFLVKIGCTVSIDNANINLPTLTVNNLKNNPETSATYFNVRLRNCSSGDGAARRIFLTWRFLTVHPRDWTLMVNSATSPNDGKNFGLKMFYQYSSSTGAITHQLPVGTGVALPSTNVEILTLRHFVQYALTPEALLDPSIITPGRFSAQAQLFVQYQ